MATAHLFQQRPPGFAGMPMAAALPRGQPMWAPRPRAVVSIPAYPARPALGNQAFAPAQSPPPPLEEDAVAELRAFLEEKGGAVPLGKLATHRPGLKKAQLEPHFYVAPPPGEKGDYIVSVDPNLLPQAGADLPAGAFGMPGAFNLPASAPKKRQREEAPGPPEPLSEEKVQCIKEFVANAGGAVLLGSVTSAFEGVKMAQLRMAGLIVGGGEGGKREHVVALIPGTYQPSQPLGIVPVAAPSEPKKKKRKKEQDPNAPPPLPLTPEALETITAFLQNSGGSLSLGKLTTEFEGVKKVQLEPHFELVPMPKGDIMISLKGELAQSAIQLQQQQLQHQLMLQQQPFQAEPLDFGGAVGLGGELGDPGIPSSLIGVAPMEQPVPSSKKKKQKPKRDPDAPPPPALEQSQVDEIAAYLQLQGGVSRLGRLTTCFPGLKKAQIEPHFLVCGDPSGDQSVCLDWNTAVSHGLQSL